MGGTSETLEHSYATLIACLITLELSLRAKTEVNVACPDPDLLKLCFAGDHAQTELITLSAYPSGALSGGALCPDTSVYFNCTALNVAFLIWERNDGQIQDYTPRDNATLQPETINGYTLFLNSSTPVVGGRRNLTSTLVGIVGSSLQTGDRIECVDNTGPLITLNFTEICKYKS